MNRKLVTGGIVAAFLLVLALVQLSGCGGGGSGSPPVGTLQVKISDSPAFRDFSSREGGAESLQGLQKTAGLPKYLKIFWPRLFLLAFLKNHREKDLINLFNRDVTMNEIINLFSIKLDELFSTSKVCRTRMINKVLFECKVKKPNPMYCEYSLSLGNGFTCKHQDRIKFAREEHSKT